MKSWLPVLCLTFAAFVFVTSEFIPVGLISEIAAGFGKTEADTGLMMTIYAWIVAGLSIPLTAYAARFDRRPLLLGLLSIFFCAHILSVLAWSFSVLVFSRIFVASAHAVFWAIAPPLGARIAPKGKRERAIALVATGSTLGSVLGIPVATYMGQILGWRFAFAGIGFAAGVVGVILYRMLPSAPARNSGSFKSVFSLFRRPELVITYLITAITMTGHYSVFTFIRPYLQQIGGIRPDMVALLLMIYGLAGLASSVYAPRHIAASLSKSSLLSQFVVMLCLLSLHFAARSFESTVLLVIVWESAFLYVNLILQNLVLLFAPDAEDVATAGFSGIYNIGIGGGALIGSLCSKGHLESVGYIGAGFVFVGWLLFVALFRRPKAAHLKAKEIVGTH